MKVNIIDGLPVQRQSSSDADPLKATLLPTVSASWTAVLEFLCATLSLDHRSRDIIIFHKAL